jgi:hypothetical protein
MTKIKEDIIREMMTEATLDRNIARNLRGIEQINRVERCRQYEIRDTPKTLSQALSGR